MSVASLSSHVLDLQLGKPARGLHITVYGSDSAKPLANGVTDADGRISAWSEPLALAPGVYRVMFATGPWYAAQQSETLYPEVVITFSVIGGQAHYHIPLLLSPYGYSTYQGS